MKNWFEGIEVVGALSVSEAIDILDSGKKPELLFSSEALEQTMAEWGWPVVEVDHPHGDDSIAIIGANRDGSPMMALESTPDGEKWVYWYEFVHFVPAKTSGMTAAGTHDGIRDGTQSSRMISRPKRRSWRVWALKK